MKMKFSYSLVVIIIIISLFAGVAASNTTSEQKTGETRIVTDMSGTEVTIPAEVNKVVNLWPASNSVMLCLGEGGRLAGTMDITKTNFWSQLVYPDIVNVPTGSDNAEELMKLQPDLIITPTQKTAENLRSLGLPAINLMFSDYDSMKKAFTLLGDILGGSNIEKARKWCTLIDTQIARVEKAVKDVPEDERPVVYYIQGQTNKGLYSTFKADSIIGDWCTIAGGEFASKKLELTESGEVTPEAILALNPDVIIIGGFAQHALYDELMSAPEWKDIKAVKNNRVYTNPNGLFPWERFGMESALQLPFAASVIHPDRFTVDLVDEVKTFYKDFVGIDLTNEQAQNMINGYGPNGEKYN